MSAADHGNYTRPGRVNAPATRARRLNLHGRLFDDKGPDVITEPIRSQTPLEHIVVQDDKEKNRAVGETGKEPLLSIHCGLNDAVSEGEEETMYLDDCLVLDLLRHGFSQALVKLYAQMGQPWGREDRVSIQDGSLRGRHEVQ